MSIKARLVNERGDLVGVSSSPLPTASHPRVDVQRLHKTATAASGVLETDGTYYYYVDITKYDYHGFQWDLTAGSGSVTITFEGSLGHNSYDSDPPLSDWDWDDITNDLFGVASWTADDTAIIDTPLPVKYLRVKAVHATGAANDSALTLWMVRK